MAKKKGHFGTTEPEARKVLEQIQAMMKKKPSPKKKAKKKTMNTAHGTFE